MTLKKLFSAVLLVNMMILSGCLTNSKSHDSEQDQAADLLSHEMEDMHQGDSSIEMEGMEKFSKT